MKVNTIVAIAIASVIGYGHGSASAATLQEQIVQFQAAVNQLAKSNAALQEQMTALQSNNALALGPYVSVGRVSKCGRR